VGELHDCVSVAPTCAGVRRWAYVLAAWVLLMRRLGRRSLL
jgi:hypothetical protein